MLASLGPGSRFKGPHMSGGMCGGIGPDVGEIHREDPALYPTPGPVHGGSEWRAV